jgi:hypothetical protein
MDCLEDLAYPLTDQECSPGAAGLEFVYGNGTNVA